MKIIAAIVLLSTIAVSTSAQAKQDFDKTEQEMQITVINYDDRQELLESYNARQTPRNQYPKGETIDGYALFSMKGTVCEIHVYRDSPSNTYMNSLGHEMRHCLEGNFH